MLTILMRSDEDEIDQIKEIKEIMRRGEERQNKYVVIVCTRVTVSLVS